MTGEAEQQPIQEERAVISGFLIAEFSSLRSEIDRRSADQGTLLSLMVTGIGAIGGLALSERATPLLLLVLPVLSAVLGNLYLDHDRAISHLGAYIQKGIHPKAMEIAAWDGAFAWESKAVGAETESRGTAWAWTTSVMTTFVGPGVVSLGFGIGIVLDAGSPVWAWALWLIGAVSTTLVATRFVCDW